MRFARACPFLLFTACALPSPPGVCPNVLPSACPQTPSYQIDVAPAIAAKCLPCHETGANQQRPLDNYPALVGDRDSVLDQLVTCLMPPHGSPQLTDFEKNAILQWLVCGAPNN